MKKIRNGYLTSRDRRILEFVDRCRVGTEDMFQRVFFSESKSRIATVSRVVRRLVRRGLLDRVTWSPGRSYVILTRRGCRAIAVPDRTPRPLTEQSLPVALAVAWHCVRTGVTRVTDREFRQRYPELWRPGLRSSIYYLTDTPRGLVLGMFLVDRGGTARRIRSKIRRLITQRDSLPAFEALIAAGRLRLTVLTGLPAQQQNIRRSLKRSTFHRVEIEVCLVPELGDILTLGPGQC